MNALRPRVLLFDVMGTVVDVDGCVQRETTAVLSRAGVALDDIGRVLSLSADRLGSLMDGAGSHAFWRGHRALRTAAVTDSLALLGLPRLDPAREAEIAAITDRLRPWPDAIAGLNQLRDAFITVALSNADTAELAAMSAAAGLSWHAVISGELVHAFKPDPAVYQEALRLLDTSPDQVLMVAAHPWDLRAAAAHGMKTAFIDRPGTEQPNSPKEFDLTASDLIQLASHLHRQQRSSR